MLLTKFKSGIAVFVVLAIVALAASGLIPKTLATEPVAGSTGAQEQGPANRDDLHRRVMELKEQVQQMQTRLAGLEQEIQAAPSAVDTSFLAKQFKYRVPFETGRTQTKDGGRIEIREVWGTRPQIEIGGQYLVRGKYMLPPGQRGVLHFYASAGGPWGQTASLDLQSTAVDEQEGEFALIHGMAGPGYFHLILTDPDRYSNWFADVYFGTGDNVNRAKP